MRGIILDSQKTRKISPNEDQIKVLRAKRLEDFKKLAQSSAYDTKTETKRRNSNNSNRRKHKKRKHRRHESSSSSSSYSSSSTSSSSSITSSSSTVVKKKKKNKKPTGREVIREISFTHGDESYHSPAFIRTPGSNKSPVVMDDSDR